jgi:hypothetical protein
VISVLSLPPALQGAARRRTAEERRGHAAAAAGALRRWRMRCRTTEGRDRTVLRFQILTVIPLETKDYYFHFLIVACVFQMEMFTVQYFWKQKTRSALGIYHENLVLSPEVSSLLALFFCHENVAIYHENYPNHIDGMLQFQSLFFSLKPLLISEVYLVPLKNGNSHQSGFRILLSLSQGGLSPCARSFQRLTSHPLEASQSSFQHL